MVSVESHPYSGIGIMRAPSAISRRPSLGSKRDSSFLDTDDESGLSSSTKRLKVAFDPRIDIRIMDDSWNNKSMELVEEEVRVAIETHLRRTVPMRDGDQYQRLVNLFTQSPFDNDAIGSKMLVKYLTAIERHASDVSQCEELLTALVNLPYLGRSGEVVAAYDRLLISAFSAGVTHISMFIERAVYDFQTLSPSMGTLPGEVKRIRWEMFNALHSTLGKVLKRHPAAVDVLLSTIRACYANDITSTRAYVQFLKNLLTLRNYIPYIEAEVLAIVVQRLVALDVQIQQDIEELEEDAEDGLFRGGRNIKVQDLDYPEDSDNESVSSSEETCTEEEERMAELRSKVAKMDVTMEMLFIYYDQQLCEPGQEPNEEVYQQLMALFLTFILPNRTRHAQFLVFHFAQSTPDRMALFAQQCVESGFGTKNAAQKCSAVAYLSSFMARAAHLDRVSIRETFEILCSYLDEMQRKYEPQCRGPDRRAYLVYYAVAQAVLYIFCFRWRYLAYGPRTLKVKDPRVEARSSDNAKPEYDEETLTLEHAEELLEERGELEWIPGIKNSLKTAIFGPLNPLRICAPAIVTEFAKLSRHVRFIEVISKLESNKRLRLGHTMSYYGTVGGIDIARRETAWDRKKGDAHHQMEPYFPFDPYHLPTSKKWLENDYLEWEPPRGIKRDDEDDEEDGSDSDSSDGEADIDDDDAILESASISS